MELWGQNTKANAMYSIEKLSELLNAIKANNNKRGSLALAEAIVTQKDIDDQQFIEDYFLSFKLDKEKIFVLA